MPVVLRVAAQPIDHTDLALSLFQHKIKNMCIISSFFNLEVLTAKRGFLR